jgi:hypothetical protein
VSKNPQCLCDSKSGGVVCRVHYGLADVPTRLTNTSAPDPRDAEIERLRKIIADSDDVANAETIQRVEDENARLRLSLEWYAELGEAYFPPTDWSWSKNGGGPDIDDYDRVDDLGERARAALEGK